MGHASIETTARYIHHTEADLEAAVLNHHAPTDVLVADAQRRHARKRPTRDLTVAAAQHQPHYTQSQAAAELGVPEGTMKIRLHRARRKLEGVMSP